MAGPINFNNIQPIKVHNNLLNTNFDKLNSQEKAFEQILEKNMEKETLFGSIEYNKNEYEGESIIEDSSEVSGFAKKVGSSIEAGLNSLNDATLASENAVKTFASGGDISVHEVMIASEKASLSMNMAIQLRNKIINAYNEINQIRL